MKLSRISLVLFPFTVYPSQLGGRGLGVGCRCTSKPGRGMLSERRGFAAAQCGKACLSVSASKFSEATPQSGRRSLHEFLSRYPVRQSLTALCGGKPQPGSDAPLYPSPSLELRVVRGGAWKTDGSSGNALFCENRPISCHSWVANGRENTSDGRENASHGRENTSHGCENASHGRENASHGRENASHGRENASHGRENASHGRENASHGRENASHGRENAAGDRESAARRGANASCRSAKAAHWNAKAAEDREKPAHLCANAAHHFAKAPNLSANTILYPPTRTATFAKGSHHQETRARDFAVRLLEVRL